MMKAVVAVLALILAACADAFLAPGYNARAPVTPKRSPFVVQMMGNSETDMVVSQLNSMLLADGEGGVIKAGLGVFLLVAAVGAFFLTTADKESPAPAPAASTPAPAPAPAAAPAPPAEPSIDVSIPYDAAAKLAYEASDKSMAYDAFKTKYEADAVADATAKKAARDAA